MIKKSTNIEYYLITALIIFSFLSRLVTVYFFRDLQFDNEWGILLNNLINYKSFSFYNFNGELIPSAYMPPLYPFFLYLIKIIIPFEESNLLYSIFFIQIILSSYSVYLFYEINKNFFSNNLSLINSIVFSVIPLNVYACGQISSINLQVISSLLFIKFLFLIIKTETNRNIIIFSIVSGLLFLIRGEFILIFIFIYLFIIWKKKIKLINLIKIAIVVTLVISPYVVRNYIHFNQFFLVKSLGYNLWKGNNELSKVEGFENFERENFSKLKSKIDNLDKNKYYEIGRDKVFFSVAIKNLKQDPFHYMKLYFKKLSSFFFIDINSSYPNYYNFFHIVPIILISLLSFPGMFVFFTRSKFENKCIGLYFFMNLIIFSLFFILPRYKLIILPVQIILACYFIEYVLKKIIKN